MMRFWTTVFVLLLIVLVPGGLAAGVWDVWTPETARNMAISDHLVDSWFLTALFTVVWFGVGVFLFGDED